MSEKKIKTPCIGVCRLNDTDEYCTGCFRSNKEIMEWRAANDERKLEIVKSAEDRKAALQ